ncbi:MAG: sigma-70 family RNA polymerase sigma factor [Lentisphaeria bacterium]|nr:sigma-70 family RNA polymerase sigma factor [Lentisphaeria bacterium]
MKKISEKEETRNLDAEALIEGNLRLVLKIANDFLGRGLPWDDLVSEGNRGLMTAARRYNPRRGAKFSTYSALWIKQAIRQAIAEQAQAVRIPIGTQQNSRRIQRCVRELETVLGRDPSDEEVAQKTGLPLVTVQRLRDKRQADMQSLNAIISNSDQDGTEFQDFFADEITPPPDQALLKIEDIEQLLSLLDTLTDRERQVLRLRFGLDGSPILTLEEVGKKLNCTNERVRQIQNQALQKLHDRMIDDERRHR